MSKHIVEIPFKEALRVWLRVAVFSFGGPAGQISVMHRIIVDEKRWISENRFLHALNYCMLLPGPEAQQLATYIGWLLHGTRGGLCAGLLFILPGFLSILGLSLLYAEYNNLLIVGGLFFGLKPAVIAIIVEALFRISKRVLKNFVMFATAVMAFFALFFLNLSFPIVIICAGLIGLIGGQSWPEKFQIIKEKGVKEVDPQHHNSATNNLSRKNSRALASSSLKVLLFWLIIWLTPLIVLRQTLGGDHVFVAEAYFFSKAAVVTFGGAYSVLAYVAQQAVEVYGWLLPGEMLDGLGMAETTPGPLIQVVQFVGFMGAYRNSGELSPILAGIFGSIITTWVTFCPCFLWIFLGAPYIERLHGNQSLNAILSTITAAVVGVIANLALWFSLHTLFTETKDYLFLGLGLSLPNWKTLNFTSLSLSLIAIALIFYFKKGIITVLGVSGLLGMLYYLGLEYFLI